MPSNCRQPYRSYPRGLSWRDSVETAGITRGYHKELHTDAPPARFFFRATKAGGVLLMRDAAPFLALTILNVREPIAYVTVGALGGRVFTGSARSS